MKKIIFVIALFASTHLVAQHRLEKIWQSDSVLNIPESVLYDSKSKLLYVSNIGDFQKEGAGSISKLDLDGKVIKNNWVTGLTAPKGLGLYKNTLYVAEPAVVTAIDVNTGSVVQRVPVEGAQMLNDITIDPKGVVFVSDTRTNKVHKIDNGKASVYLENMKSANGVLYVGSDLYVLTGGSLQKVDATKKISQLAEGMESSTDGIEMVKANEFIMSCWAGVIYYVKSDGTKQMLLDTRDKKINSADIGYDSKNQIVYVPTFFKKNVVAYQLK